MARTASYTDNITLTPGTPVVKPKTDTAPDLAPWIARLSEVDKQTRQANRSDISIPFTVPADKALRDKDGNPVKDENGKVKMISASKTVKLRFQQAAAKMGVGVSITIEQVNSETNRVLVSTQKRRERKGRETTANPAPNVSQPVKPSMPVGLPKPKGR